MLKTCKQMDKILETKSNLLDGGDEFERWLEDVKSKFVLLSSDKRQQAFDSLLEHVCAEERYILMRKISDNLCRDILTLLPTELQEYICHEIDICSLLIACRVSKEWNEVISSLQNVWHRKCLKLGYGSESAEKVNWKELCISTMKLLNNIEKGIAFQDKDVMASCLSRDRITGLEYCDKYLIGCADEQVGVWSANDYGLLLTFSTPARISCVRIDKEIIALGHSTGLVTTWQLGTTGRDKEMFAVLNYEHRGHTGVVMTLSINAQVDILATGSTDCSIRLWQISTGVLLKNLPSHDHWIIQVTLYISEDGFNKNTLFKGKHSLLAKTRDDIKIFSWPNVCQDKSKNKPYGDIYEIESSEMTFPLMSINNFITPGCQVNSGRLIYVSQTMVGDEQLGDAEMVFECLKSHKCIGRVGLGMKVRKLLAVGRKYALLLLPHSHQSKFNLVIAELSTGKVVGGCHLPHSSSSSPDLAQIVVGNMNFLNGWAYQKPGDLVVALGLLNGHIRVVSWKEMCTG